MHPPEALIAFGAGPSSGPADAVEKYLPAVKAWEARAAGLGRSHRHGSMTGPGVLPPAPVAAANDPRRVRDRDEDGRAGVIPDGQDGWASTKGRMYLSVQPLHPARGHQRFCAVLFSLFTPRSTMYTDVDLYWLVDGKKFGSRREEDDQCFDETTKQDKNHHGEQSGRHLCPSAISPGRYSEHERRVVTFQQWYLGDSLGTHWLDYFAP